MRTTLPTSWGFIAGVDSPETGASVLQDANAVKTKTSFEELFEFVATSDDSAYICVPAALKFRQEICGGEDAIISYNIKLANDAADAVAGQPEGRREVRLAAAPEGAGRVCIRVEDSGPGLSGESALRVFEPFHSTKTSGMGLGLAISRAIAEAHGGHLLAEVADHGVFKLILPIEPDQ